MSHSFDGIPAGSACTVTETANGATATVTATVSGNGQTVTVPAGKVVSVQRDGRCVPRAESGQSVLTVTKTIAGPAARRHGRIAIVVACGGPLHTFAFLIRARTGAGSMSRYFDDLPAGSRCTVNEAKDGHTRAVAVRASATRKRVTVRSAGGVTARLTDRFSFRAKPLFTG